MAEEFPKLTQESWVRSLGWEDSLVIRILEWVAMPSSREFSQSRDRIQVLLHCRWILYHMSHQETPPTKKKKKKLPGELKSSLSLKYHHCNESHTC